MICFKKVSYFYQSWKWRQDKFGSLPVPLEDYLKETFRRISTSQFWPLNPKPENTVPGRKLNCYLQELLKDKKKSHELAIDATLEMIQSKIDDIMGPLSKLWTSVNNLSDRSCMWQWPPSSGRCPPTYRTDNFVDWPIQFYVEGERTFWKLFSLITQFRQPWGRRRIYSGKRTNTSSGKSFKTTLWKCPR